MRASIVVDLKSMVGIKRISSKKVVLLGSAAAAPWGWILLDGFGLRDVGLD